MIILSVFLRHISVLYAVKYNSFNFLDIQVSKKLKPYDNYN